SPAPVTYRWRRNGTPLFDGPSPSGAVVVGSATSTLTFSAVHLADTGSTFDCRVSNTCTTLTSSGASLTIICRADFNSSGVVTMQDLFDFLRAWFASDPRADFDGV